jgi:hypothetical protein
MTDAPDFIRFDPYADVASSLRLLAVAIDDVARHPGTWKWVVLSSHSALQGALVCTLLRPNEFDIWNEDSAKRLANYFEKSRTEVDAEFPKLWLARFNTLLDRAQCSTRPADARLRLTQNEQSLLLSLTDHRDGFTHFKLDGWSISCADLCAEVECAVRVTTDIMTSHSTVAPFLEGEQQQLFAKRFNAISDAWKILMSEYVPI